jgi:alpha-mannosidase
MFYTLFLSGLRAQAPPSAWLKGWAKTISGEAIGYHSSYPDATSGLIVRATDGTMAIEWETGHVPDDYHAPFATFFWLAGLATQKGGHRFFLSVDGQSLFEFRTGKDASEKTWDIPGKDGSSLSFKTTMVDQFQELFGFMFLKLPASMLKPGRPLRIKVVGEKGGGRDWFMIFPYDLEPWIRASGERALIRREGRALQLVRVEVSHLGPPEEAVIRAESGESRSVRIETGYNAVHLPVAAVAAEKDILLTAKIGNAPAKSIGVRIRPVERRTIYLLPHSHVDIGYSDLQTAVEKNHWTYLEEAIELSRKTQAYPPGARFKWNVEVLWPVETYLRQAGPEKRQAFIDAVRKGWIGLQALLANELTGLCLPEELEHLADFSRRLAAVCGLPINSAMITDIPSYTWGIVPALAQSGVKYFSSGPNYMPTLPDSGDRIGSALKVWADKPFYWVSASGKEKVLFWMAGRGYSWFHGLNMGNLDIEKKQPIFDYLRTLEESGYPYDIVQVRYTTGGDNGPPDPKLSDFVKTWNEEFESPKFVIATSEEMFEEFERRYADKIPYVRGDFTPYWEDGAASTARELAMNRASAERLLTAETLWALGNRTPFPAEELYEAWRQVLLFDEHTWGAADSVSNPDGENARTQWDYKRAFAVEADKKSRNLLSAALEAFGRNSEKLPKAAPSRSELAARPQSLGASREGPPTIALDVINAHSWERTDIVFAPENLSSPGDRVEDDRGQAVPSQRLSTGELAFLAERVPGFGARRFLVKSGNPLSRGSAHGDKKGLKNGSLELAVDPSSGAITSLIWKKAGSAEFVDAREETGLNAFLYVAGRNPKNARTNGTTRISVQERGPLVASLLIESEAPGCHRLQRELRIYSPLDRLDIIDRLEKQSVRQKESVHMAFPFAIPSGTLRLNLGRAIIRPEVDQIPGSCKDYFCVQGGLDVSNEKFGISWISLDAPLVEIGRMTDETLREKGVRSWRTKVGPTQAIYSYIMNNYWHTNYKADQQGETTFRYSLKPHRGFRSEDLARFGMERSRPLFVIEANEKAAPLAPILSVNPPEILIVSLRPSADQKAYIAELYNASQESRLAILSGKAAAPGKIFLSDLFEHRLEKPTDPLRLSSLETVIVRIEKRE